MAKPMSAAYTDGAGSSTCHLKRPRDHLTRPRRRRKSSAATPRLLSPSSTLLSLLATIASSSVAQGSPAPPAFLCPSIDSRAAVSRRKFRRDAPSTTNTPSSPLQNRAVAQARAVIRNIPDKFERGEDGIWRRVDSYTLYGVCPNCATNAVSAIDDQITKNNSTTTMDKPPDTTATNSLQLPRGWATATAKPGGNQRTTLILAMSLVLAFLICFLVTGCLLWRNSLRRRYKQKDVEMKGKSRRRRVETAEDREREIMSEREKETKVHQKLWAKATARWKANARYAARQRRGKRPSAVVRSSQARSSSISLDNPRDALTSSRSSSSRSPSRSLSPSRRPSSESSRIEETQQTPPQSSPNNQPIPSIQLSPPPEQLNPSPPAYQQKPDALSSQGLAIREEGMSGSLSSTSRRHSQSSNSDGGNSTVSTIPSAHVATDDKAVLARLAEMASAPPEDDSTDQSFVSHVQVSAPEWRDEELEDIIAQTDPSNESNTQPNNSPFPPPPSKAQLMAPDFYDYPYSFEEMSGPELELGPSAPPFEETPSTQPFDSHTTPLLPSAPPLDDFYVSEDPSPSAPDCVAHSHGPAPTQEDPGLPAPSIELRGESDDTAPSVGNLPSNQDEGRLPDYHP